MKNIEEKPIYNVYAYFDKDERFFVNAVKEKNRIKQENLGGRIEVSIQSDHDCLKNPHLFEIDGQNNIVKKTNYSVLDNEKNIFLKACLKVMCRNLKNVCDFPDYEEIAKEIQKEFQ